MRCNPVLVFLLVGFVVSRDVNSYFKELRGVCDSPGSTRKIL
jgi:hypothetical protein